MECVVCFSEFSTAVPRLLGCGHTLCEGCCRALHRGGRVECPQCRHLTPCASAADLKRNYALEELISGRRELGQVALLRQGSGPPRGAAGSEIAGALGRSRHTCDNCQKTAELWCPGCGDVNYCNACYAHVHDALPQVLLKKNREAHRKVALEETGRCSVHPVHTLKLWCEQEKKLICSECVRIGGHARHEFTTIKGAANRYRLALESSLAAFRARAAQVTTRQETAQKLLQTLEFEEKQRFENAAQSLAQLEETVQRRRAELLDAMSLRTAESRRSLATFLGLLGNGCHEVEKDFASISRIMSSEHGGDSELLLNREKIAVLEADIERRLVLLEEARNQHGSAADATVVIAGLDTALKAVTDALAALKVCSQREAQALQNARPVAPQPQPPARALRKVEEEDLNLLGGLFD